MDLNPKEIPLTFSAWNRDSSTRNKSSSGGVFSALAELIIDRGGCVFGVVWEDELLAKHDYVETKEALHKMLGSKYIQSNPLFSLRKVKEKLKEGRYVLFSGTPCQISGLKSYLRKPHEKLFTVDVSCHGVPSRKLFDEYIKYQECILGGKITQVRMRDKSTGWIGYSIVCENEEGQIYSREHNNDLFMRGFLSDICLNEPCYNCAYSKRERISDLTLADYWGVWNKHRWWKTEKGVSLVLTNTNKGHDLIKSLSTKLKLYKEDAKSAISYNGGLLRDAKPIPPQRNEFISGLGSDIFPMHINKYIEGVTIKNDIALLGMWMSCNYGALLTGFSLYRTLQKMGKDVTLIDHDPLPRFRNSKTVFRQFIKNEKLQTHTVNNTNDTLTLNNKFSTFLLGSDQVWGWNYIGNRTPYYLLGFVRGDKRKIAYASSLGSFEDFMSEDFRSKIRLNLNRFDDISVREDSAVVILKDKYSIDATFVLDPVFLVDQNEWISLSEKSTQEWENSSYIASYIMDPSEATRSTLLHIAAEKGLPLQNMVDIQFDDKEKIDILNLPNTPGGVTVYDWISCLMKSDFIVTDSFHGVCFAIIFNKPFICIANAGRGMARFHSLLSLFGLMDRLVYNSKDIYQKPELLNSIDYTKTNNILEHKKVFSLSWLSNALQKPRDKSFILSSLAADHINKNILRIIKRDSIEFIKEKLSFKVKKIILGLLKPFKK